MKAADPTTPSRLPVHAMTRSSSSTSIRPMSPLIKKPSVHFEADKTPLSKPRQPFDFTNAAIPSPLRSDLLQPNGRPKQTRPSSSQLASSRSENTTGWSVGDTVVLDPFGEGTIAYIGETQFKEGTWIGLHLTSNAHGKNNGTVQGVRYFDCPEKHGLFLHASKVPLSARKEVREVKSLLTRPTTTPSRVRASSASTIKSVAVTKEVNDLQARLQALEEEVAAQVTANALLTQDLKAARQAKDRAETMQAEAELIKVDHTLKQVDLEAQIGRLTRENAQLQSEMAALRAAGEETIETTQHLLEAKEEEMAHLREQLKEDTPQAETAEMIQRVLSENDTFRRQWEAAEAAKQDLQTRHDDLQKTHAALGEAHATAQSERSTLQAQIAALEDELHQVHLALDHAHASSKKVTPLRSPVNGSLDTVESESDKAAETVRKLEALKGAFQRNVQQWEEENAASQRKISALEETVAALRNDNQLLSIRVKEEEASIVNEKATNAALMEDVHRFEEEVEAISKTHGEKLTAMGDKLKACESVIAELEAALTTQKETSSKKVAEANAEKASFEQKWRQAEFLCETLRGQIEAKQTASPSTNNVDLACALCGQVGDHTTDQCASLENDLFATPAPKKTVPKVTKAIDEEESSQSGISEKKEEANGNLELIT